MESTGFSGDNMNFKRKKTRRNIRCSICTPHRWKGNHNGRFKEKEEVKGNEADKEIRNFEKESILHTVVEERLRGGKWVTVNSWGFGNNKPYAQLVLSQMKVTLANPNSRFSLEEKLINGGL